MIKSILSNRLRNRNLFANIRNTYNIKSTNEFNLLLFLVNIFSTISFNFKYFIEKPAKDKTKTNDFRMA